MQQRQNPWADADSLSAIGDLISRWLKRDLHSNPWNGGPPDDETSELMEDLVFVNEKGLVTIFSQPGISIDSTGYSQRAAVQAYAERSLAKSIASLGLSTELMVFLYEPAAEGGYMVPITTDGYRPWTWCGGAEPIDELLRLGNSALIDQLLKAWQLVIIDPVWGRKSFLWENLRKVMEQGNSPWDITPSIDLGRDHVR